MTIKEFERGQLFFGNEEIGFRPLGELAEIEQDENCETSEDIPFLDIGGSYEFTAEIQPPERMTFGDFILALHGFDVEKLKQNNWRKCTEWLCTGENMGKAKRKPRPQPLRWYWWDTDNCWDCNHGNNCNQCKRLKRQKVYEREKRERRIKYEHD